MDGPLDNKDDIDKKNVYTISCMMMIKIIHNLGFVLNENYGKS